MPPKYVAAIGYCEYRENRNSLRVSLDDSGLPPLIGAPKPVASASSSSSSTINNIDAHDANEYVCVVHYVVEALEDLRLAEQKHQLELPSEPVCNRLAAVSVIAKVHHSFSLRLETLTMAISMLDRLAGSTVQTGTGPLALADGNVSINLKAALATLMLASTLEEEYPLHPDDVMHTSQKLQRTNSGGDQYFWQRNFSSNDLRCLAWQIARQLEFNLWSPNWLHFLRRFSKAAGLVISEHQLAKQICLVAVRDYEHFVFPVLPSQLAAAAVMRVCEIRKQKNRNSAASSTVQRRFKKWSKTLAHYTGYARAEIEPIEQILPDVSL